MAAGDPTPSKKWDWGMYALIVFLVLVPLLMIGLPPLVALLRGQSLSDAAAGTRTADDVLNFLEGASVLIGGAVAVAAIYGFRNAQEVRKELREEMAQLKALKQDIETHIEEQMQAAQEGVKRLQQNTLDLSEAYRDLLHRNYPQAYRTARTVLQRDPDNIQALYISGWLSMQFVKERTVDDAINDLEHALQIAQTDRVSTLRMATIRAALGVMYRRKGAKLKDIDPEESARYFQEAKKLLRSALEDAPRLLDLYSESFRGPLGGLYRDMGNIKAAIKEYKEATKITPGSSYPWGNLAQLYLKQGRIEEAMHAFERTHEVARYELAAAPDDYYHLMDLAMSATMLGEFEEAQKWLDQALGASLTAEMLETSLKRGWELLLESCPQDEEEWEAVREHLETARDQLKKKIELA